MKTILLVAGSRAGVEFFQSLLEGHTQILQFPGIIQTNKKLFKILSFKNPNSISSNFINNYPHFFDSRLNVRERHYMLGDDKKQYYQVDKEKFKINFLKIGKAVLPPVSYFPNEEGSSSPTYIPTTNFDVKPINHVSVLLFVVPVFPAMFKFKFFNFLPVPR